MTTTVSLHHATRGEFRAEVSRIVREAGVAPKRVVIRAGVEAFAILLAQSYADLRDVGWVELRLDREMEDWTVTVGERE